MLDHFRSHIERSAGSLCQFFGLRDSSHTEVDQLDCVITHNHDVVRFDVPMANVLGVTVIDCVQKTMDVASNLLLCKSLILSVAYLFIKRFSWHILHHKEYLFLIVVSFMVLYNVRVV